MGRALNGPLLGVVALATTPCAERTPPAPALPVPGEGHPLSPRDSNPWTAAGSRHQANDAQAPPAPAPVTAEVPSAPPSDDFKFLDKGAGAEATSSVAPLRWAASTSPPPLQSAGASAPQPASWAGGVPARTIPQPCPSTKAEPAVTLGADNLTGPSTTPPCPGACQDQPESWMRMIRRTLLL